MAVIVRPGLVPADLLDSSHHTDIVGWRYAMTFGHDPETGDLKMTGEYWHSDLAEQQLHVVRRGRVLAQFFSETLGSVPTDEYASFNASRFTAGATMFELGPGDGVEFSGALSPDLEVDFHRFQALTTPRTSDLYIPVQD